jgi:hypothetical protein
MPTTLFTFVGLFDRALATCEHLLKKGEAFAADKGLAAGEILDWKLIDDMHPLSFQLMVVINFTRNWPARVADLPLPGDIDSQATDLAGFHAAIADARAWLAALKPEQLESREETVLTHKLGSGMEPTLSGGQWITGFAATNIYFHMSMAYAILRSKGVPIGKSDLFPLGL